MASSANRRRSSGGGLRGRSTRSRFVDESAGLGESSRQVERNDAPDDRDEIDVSPAARSDVGQSERHHGDPGAETGSHGEDADRICPAVARHLLRRDDPDDEGEGDPHRATDRLSRHEQPEARSDRTEQRQQRGQPGHDHQDLAAADPIGDDGCRKGEHDAGAHDRTGIAFRRLADAEIVGGESDRLGEDRVDERSRHRRSGEEADHEELCRIELVGR